MRTAWLIALLLWSGAESACAEAPSDLQDIVRVEPVIESPSAGSTSPFRLGLLFTIKDDWHIYWKNPGEAGMPTDVSVGAPEGFEVRDLEWPLPEIFSQHRRFVGYGYSKRVLLWRTAAPRAPVAAGSLHKFVLSAAWLACGSALCVPGKARVEREVAAAGAQQPGGAFREWQAALPLSLEQADFVAGPSEAALNGNRGRVKLRWRAAPRSVQWLPEGGAGVKITDIDIATTGMESTVTFYAAFAGGRAPRFNSLAVVEFEDGTRHGVIIPIG